MRSDVHQAALKAAAKVAFSVALLNGCSSAEPVLGGVRSEEGDEAASSAYANSAAKKADPKNSPDPCPSETDPGQPKPSCETVLAAAFPTPGGFQIAPVAQSKEVVACCDEELTNIPKDQNWDSRYRWDCCQAYDADAPDSGRLTDKHIAACTPWGPPVPPSMKRARRAIPDATRFLSKAVA